MLARRLERHADPRGDRRFVERVTDGGRRRTTSRPPSGSRSSTTTARSGARSRCRSSSASSSSASPRWPRPTPSLRDKQPWKAAREQDYAWLGDVITKHYHGDDSDVKVLMARHPPGVRRHERRATTTQAADAFLRGGKHPTLGQRIPRLRLPARWSSCCATSRRTVSRTTSPRAAIATSCGRSRKTSTDPAGARDRQLERAALPGG